VNISVRRPQLKAHPVRPAPVNNGFDHVPHLTMLSTSRRPGAYGGVCSRHRPRRTHSACTFSSPRPGSPGGRDRLYNFLRALPVPIIMHNTGSIDSMRTLSSSPLTSATRRQFSFLPPRYHVGICTRLERKLTWISCKKPSAFQGRANPASRGIMEERTSLTTASSLDSSPR